MKKILFLIFLFTILSAVNTVQASEKIQMYIDDTIVTSDVEPFAENGRTFVPVRSVFEKLGAEVSWTDSTKQVTIKTLDTRIVLTLNSTIAYVNSVPYSLDVAPIIKESRTFIPLRFVTEKLGYSVKWIQEDNSVRIYTRIQPPETPSINGIDVVELSDRTVITINVIGSEKPVISAASDPERFILDYKNTQLSINDGKKRIDSSLITEVRYAIHPDYARVVIESPDKISCAVDHSQNGTVITVTKAGYIPPQYAPSERVLVAVDAGHGGDDCGAVGYDEDGQPIVYESHANLKIAHSVRSHLEQAGIDVIMTRQTDVKLGDTQMDDLLERSRIANEAGATFFVSIHNNAFSSPDATGTEILFADTEEKVYQGITSKQLAKNVLAPLVKATGLYNRGVKDSPKIVVLRTTYMPSILVETVFVTNPDDRAVIMNDAKINEIGKAIADGVIKSLEYIR